MKAMHRTVWWPVGLLLVPMLCLMAETAGSETPVTQLSLQLRRGEAEATPPVEPPAEEGFARFDRMFGGFGIMSGSFDKPVGIVVDADENLIVLDQGNNRVQRLDANGQFLSEFGERGTRKDQFTDPVAIALSQTELYVLDSGNNRIQVFHAWNRLGGFIREWGSLGSHEGSFNNPRDIALAGSEVYVADPENDRIQKFTDQGKFIEEWNRFTNRSRQEIPYGSIVALAYQNERFGYMLALDAEHQAIIRFELNGDYVDTLPLNPPGECRPVRIAVDNVDHYIFVLDQLGNRVLRYSKDGAYQGEIKGEKEPLSKPSGFFADKEHRRFYVVDTGNNRIQRFYWR